VAVLALIASLSLPGHSHITFGDFGMSLCNNTKSNPHSHMMVYTGIELGGESKNGQLNSGAMSSIAHSPRGFCTTMRGQQKNWKIVSGRRLVMERAAGNRRSGKPKPICERAAGRERDSGHGGLSHYCLGTRRDRSDTRWRSALAGTVPREQSFD
jgi:hypothetical protein